MRETPPALLRHLTNVSDDEVDNPTSVLGRRPDTDADDPDAWGPADPPVGIVVDVDPPEGAAVGTGFADFRAVGFINPDGSRSI